MKTAVPILLYHSVDTKFSDAYRRWALSPSKFASQMAILSDLGFQPITISQLVKSLRVKNILPKRPVIITFDDGFRDFGTYAFPVLQDHKFSATFYVVAGHVGGTSRWLSRLGEGERPMATWEELRMMASEGIEIGSHTVSHQQLDILPLERAIEEIQLSKTILEEGLDAPVESFAYPHGYTNPVVRQIVRDVGYSSACRVGHALSSPMENFFALSRIIVSEEMDDHTFIRTIGGGGLPISPPRHHTASDAWRMVRKFQKITDGMWQSWRTT